MSALFISVILARTRRGLRNGSRAASSVADPYLLGQLSELCVDEDLLEDDDFEDGVEDALLVAAFAMAAPPPTSMPERTTAARARFTGVTTCVHLLSPMRDRAQSRARA
jgi:hypothetical protein